MFTTPLGSMCKRIHRIWRCGDSTEVSEWCDLVASLECLNVLKTTENLDECCSTQCCNEAIYAIQQRVQVLFENARQRIVQDEKHPKRSPSPETISKWTELRMELDQSMRHHYFVCLPYLTENGGYTNEQRQLDGKHPRSIPPLRMYEDEKEPSEFSEADRVHFRDVMQKFQTSPLMAEQQALYEKWLPGPLVQPLATQQPQLQPVAQSQSPRPQQMAPPSVTQGRGTGENQEMPPPPARHGTKKSIGKQPSKGQGAVSSSSTSAPPQSSRPKKQTQTLPASTAPPLREAAKKAAAEIADIYERSGPRSFRDKPQQDPAQRSSSTRAGKETMDDVTASRPSSSMSGQRPASQTSTKSSAASGVLRRQMGVISSLGVASLEEMKKLIKGTAQKLTSIPAHSAEPTDMQMFDYRSRTGDLRVLAETCSGLELILGKQHPIEPGFPQHQLNSMAAECRSMSDDIRRLQSPLDQWFESQDGELQGILQTMTSNSLALVSEANSSQVSFAVEGEGNSGRVRGRSPVTAGSKRRATVSTTRNASEDAGPPPLRQEAKTAGTRGRKLTWTDTLNKRLVDLRTQGKSWRDISAIMGPAASSCRTHFQKNVESFLIPAQAAAEASRNSQGSPTSSSGLSTPLSSPEPPSPDGRKR